VVAAILCIVTLGFDCDAILRQLQKRACPSSMAATVLGAQTVLAEKRGAALNQWMHFSR
jgi:hypothetical protein